MPRKIEICSIDNFNEVQHYILQFELDGRHVYKDEFLTLTIASKLVSFGRIREHKSCSEMCSLAVIESERLKGYGKALTTALIQKATQPIFLVSVIPYYFEGFGFYICTEYPEEIQEKLKYCNESLAVNEKYVVMTNQNMPTQY
ncbi:MAG: GNAT family N-acetyltransferase [Bacteroidia bacterium]|jgi:N-acetylglutamate synthase-like GNAT family acetyltransferase|nr:GNAT family N-acetyltransferase [Bacteroidia bacterium]